MKSGFFRVAAVVPPVEIANPQANASHIIDELRSLDGQGVDLAVFPELCVTGYTCGDLFHSRLLLDKSDEALLRIAAATADLILSRWWAHRCVRAVRSTTVPWW